MDLLLAADLVLDNPGALVVSNPGNLATNPAAVYLAGLSSAEGRRVQRQALATVADLLAGVYDPLAINWALLRYSHVAFIKARLVAKYAPATVNRVLMAVKGVLKCAWRLGLIPVEDYHRAIDVPAAKGETLPAGRALSGGEIAALMAACERDNTAAGVRDGALIALLYSCGLRRAEVCALQLADYDQETGALVVNGKGSKQRLVYLVNGARAAFEDWLYYRGDHPGAIFCELTRAGNLGDWDGFTPPVVFNIVNQRAAQAGIAHLSPHDFRRSFVSDLLDAGIDAVTVSKMAGHANTQTTARYDRRPEAAKQKAAGALFVPYGRK